MHSDRDFVHVTQEGLVALEDELKRRRDVLRVEIAARLNEAIKMGDLSENADYHAAKEEQGFNEGRIKEVESMLRRVKVIEKASASDIVGMGASVTIVEEGEAVEEETYAIVGAQEADPSLGRISNESPIGRALMGAKVGSVVTAKTPSGDMRFKIIKIE